MEETHVVETQAHQAVIEAKQPQSWIKILAVVLFVAGILAALFAWNSYNNTPDTNTELAPTTVVSPLPTNRGENPPPFDKQPLVFECPTSEYVNCMPGPGPRNPQCEKEFLNWAQENCEGFQGAAY